MESDKFKCESAVGCWERKYIFNRTAFVQFFGCNEGANITNLITNLTFKLANKTYNERYENK